MTIKSQIAAARALADAATDGPWIHAESEYWGAVRSSEHDQLFAHSRDVGHRGREPIMADCRFVAASRTLVPQLCAALERACELLHELDEDLGPDSLSVRIRAFLAGEVTRG